ncbi:MAG: hypothetical protein ACI4RT_04935 [Candidatus Spyradenecus sp.]
MKWRLSLLLLLGALGLCGCISRRSGYAASNAELRLGMTYREVVAQLGNPSYVRALPEGTEALWAGMATSGSEFSLKYYGAPLLKLGRTRSQAIGRRMRFDAAGRLTASTPTGTGEPAWGWLPFGKE